MSKGASGKQQTLTQFPAQKSRFMHPSLQPKEKAQQAAQVKEQMQKAQQPAQRKQSQNFHINLDRVIGKSSDPPAKHPSTVVNKWMQSDQVVSKRLAQQAPDDPRLNNNFMNGRRMLERSKNLTSQQVNLEGGLDLREGSDSLNQQCDAQLSDLDNLLEANMIQNDLKYSKQMKRKLEVLPNPQQPPMDDED
mmetsp:Transcript_12849/g.21738  ORF Transcript_12849/g.21738 Transcript_12849/m.21738 type:complete len:192 (-) Transcript_12849:128-703(-)